MSFRDWQRFGDTNVGIGMVQDSPQEKQIARLESIISNLRSENLKLEQDNKSLLTERCSCRKALDELARDMQIFADEGLRPDEWLLQEWIQKARGQR